MPDEIEPEELDESAIPKEELESVEAIVEARNLLADDTTDNVKEIKRLFPYTKILDVLLKIGTVNQSESVKIPSVAKSIGRSFVDLVAIEKIKKAVSSAITIAEPVIKARLENE